MLSIEGIKTSDLPSALRTGNGEGQACSTSLLLVPAGNLKVMIESYKFSLSLKAEDYVRLT